MLWPSFDPLQALRLALKQAAQVLEDGQFSIVKLVDWVSTDVCLAAVQPSRM